MDARTIIKLDGGHSTVVHHPFDEVSKRIVDWHHSHDHGTGSPLLWFAAKEHDEGLSIDPRKVVALIPTGPTPSQAADPGND